MNFKNFPRADRLFREGVTSLAGLSDVVTQNSNLGLGGALHSATGGSNICLGAGAGAAITTSGSVCIGAADVFITGYADNAAAEAGCGENSVCIGASCMSEAAVSAQGPFSVCVGPGAGLTGVGQAALCLGAFSGANGPCGARSILAGDNAGGPIGASSPVGEDCVVMSTAAQCPHDRGIVIGAQAQGSGAECVVVGNAASGFEHSVSLGNKAQALSGSIVLNATADALASPATDSLCVQPIRVVASAATSSENNIRLPLTSTGFTHVLLYDPVTFEIKACQLDSIV